jgi:hypothetical protein
VQFAFQLFHPPTVLPRFHGTGCTRLAQTRNGVLLLSLQLRRIQPPLAAPGAACRLIHRRRGDHRLQSGRRCPALAAAARSIGQRGPPSSAPTSPYSHLPHVTHAPPMNSPAAANAPRSDPYTPLRIEPLPDVRAPKGSDLNRATTALTQREPAGLLAPMWRHCRHLIPALDLAARTCRLIVLDREADDG